MLARRDRPEWIAFRFAIVLKEVACDSTRGSGHITIGIKWSMSLINVILNHLRRKPQPLIQGAASVVTVHPCYVFGDPMSQTLVIAFTLFRESLEVDSETRVTRRPWFTNHESLRLFTSNEDYFWLCGKRFVNEFQLTETHHRNPRYLVRKLALIICNRRGSERGNRCERLVVVDN